MIGSIHDKIGKDKNDIFGKIFKITLNKKLISYTKNNIQFINFLENYIDSEDWGDIHCDFSENDVDLEVLPQFNKCPSSYYKFKKYFDLIDDAMLEKHYYCPNCNILETNADCNVIVMKRSRQRIL